MTHRYQAPEDITAVFSSHGEHRVGKNGEISLADDAPESAHEALRAAGCQLIGGEPKAKPEKKAPASGKSSSKGAGKKAPPAKPAEPPAAQPEG